MTIDKRRLPRPKAAKPGQLPQFTPAPRARQRHDGWILRKAQDERGCATSAHPEPVEGRHPDAASFRAAWEAALALGIQQLEDIAPHPICAANRHFGSRALYGQEVPVYSYGKLIGSRVVHNDRLLMFMLRNRAPTRFTADGRAAARQSSIADPAHANQLSRLKKQWHKEWEEELLRKNVHYDHKKVTEGVVTKLDTMRERWIEGMTPRTRALFEAFSQAEDEDLDAKEASWRLAAPSGGPASALPHTADPDDQTEDDQ